MSINKLKGIYQILIGSGMIGIWIFLYISSQIPELETEPIRIIMHIIAEVITGILLLISGFYVLIRGHKQEVLYNISLGALIYTLIASTGYYAQKAAWSIVVVFITMLIISIILLLKFKK